MSKTNESLPSGGNDGDERPLGPEEFLIFGDLRYAFIEPTNAELALIRIRVIALENLVVALLAEASDRSSKSRAKWQLMFHPGPASRIIL